MNRFDFQRDGLPDAFVAVRAFRLPRRLRAAAWALATVALVSVACACFEAVRIRSALADEARESVRCDATRARLAAASLELHEVTRLLDQDRRLRAVRASGVRAAARVVRVGNLVPRGVWLHSIVPADRGLAIEGAALDVASVDRMIARLVANGAGSGTHLLRLARTSRESAPPLVSFSLEVRAWL